MPWNECEHPVSVGPFSLPTASAASPAHGLAARKSRTPATVGKHTNPRSTQALTKVQLLRWLQDEALRDVTRRQHGEPEHLLPATVMEAVAAATPEVTDARYDSAEQSPMVRFDDGYIAPWSELSGGHRRYMALVADIARRAAMLNRFDGSEAPTRVEGVVLIDKFELHLHPRSQRLALAGLRHVFPRLQFVVTTHSPQVLASVENRQVRCFVDGQLRQDIHVWGRDTNSILRDHMHTGARDEAGTVALRRLYDAIDFGDLEVARRLHKDLRERWGGLDPALIRAATFMDD